MKTRMWLLVLGAVVLAWQSGLALAEGDAPRARPDRGARAGGDRGGVTAKAIADTMKKELALDEDAAKKIDDAAKEAQEKLDEWKKANEEKTKAAQEEMTKAREAKDQTAMQAAMKKMAELRAEQTKVATDPMLAVLNDEQKAKWAAYSLYQEACGMMERRAGLTDEQKTAIKAKAAEECAKCKDKTGEELTKAHAEAVKAVREFATSQLTDEQKAKMTGGRRPAGGEQPKKDAPKKEE